MFSRKAAKMKKSWLILCLISWLIFSVSGEYGPKKRVCIIGAGASGLASVKLLADRHDEFEPLIFEKNSDVGGLWIYTDNVDSDQHGLPVHSAAYKYLRTNIPKELMAFPDYRNFAGENRSYVTHETVLKYLRNYTDHFDLRRYIVFDRLVEKVTPITNNGDWRKTKWSIETRDLTTDENFEIFCDVVMVCNGHFFKPRIPEIQGISSFPGNVLHSHNYRKPEDFTNQVVVVLGAGPSGIDISTELIQHAKTVYISHNKPKIPVKLPKNMLQVAGVQSANGRELTLKDGSTLTADALIYCTGYLYDYPFLDTSTGIDVNNNHVRPLYKQIVNINHPSMGMIGLPNAGISFVLFYEQVQYYISMLQGKAELPDEDEMLNDSDRLPLGKSERDAHYLGEAQWDYYTSLSEAGKFDRLPDFYKKGYFAWRSYSVANLFNYKNSDLVLQENGRIAFRRHTNKQPN